jgi:hypothetical protein
MLFETQNGDYLRRFKRSHRLGSNWKFNLESWMFCEISPNEILLSVRNDQFMQFTLTNYLL